MVDTSAVLESGLHFGEWAKCETRFTSEYGIGDGDFVKHGNSREPISNYNKLIIIFLKVQNFKLSNLIKFNLLFN